MNCVSCGESISPPDDEAKWDRFTEIIDGTEYVVAVSYNVTCPVCGTSDAHPAPGETPAEAHRIHKPVDPPVLLTDHKQVLS